MQTYSSMNEMWSGACRDLDNEGVRHESRAGETIEVVGWSGCLEDVDKNLLVDETRRLDPAYACAELLWYLSGERTVERMCAYAPSYKRFANPQSEDGIAMGAYGDRWRSNPGFTNLRDAVENIKGVDLNDQLDAAAYLLEHKPETRQAVVAMWDSGDVCEAVIGQANDLPCTLSMQFIRRGKVLHCSVCMRSNDVWLGMPYDVFCFTSIQRIMARRLGLYAGKYVHNVGSLHAYARDFDKGLDLGKIGRWPSDPVAHGYDDRTPRDEGAWDIEAALEVEAEWRRKPDLKAQLPFSPGGLLGDAAIVCAAKMQKNANVQPVTLPQEVSPALREAWRLKYDR